MVQKEVVKEKEAEIKENVYDYQERRVKEMKQRALTGVKVIRGKDNPFALNRQGYIRHYAHEERTDLACPNWAIFSHDIRVHSGRHRHQGGYHLFVIKGVGYTTVDGIRYDWKEGDLILLPIKKGGVVHQHFNLDGKPSRWVAFNHLRFAETYGRFREQKEVIPDYTKKKG